MTKRKIAVVVTHTFVIRNFLYTGLIDKIKNSLGKNIEFISPLQVDEFSSLQNNRFKNLYLPVTGYLIPTDFPKFIKFIQKLRRRIYSLEVDNSGIVQLKMRRKIYGSNPLRIALVKLFVLFLKIFLPRSGIVRNKIRELIDFIGVILIPPLSYLEKNRFDLLIVASPGSNAFDLQLIYQAKKVGTPTVCIMNSWDNMITKGSIMAKVDRFLLWNSEMCQQGKKYHGYPFSKMQAVGALQFADYSTPVKNARVKDVMTKLGIEPDSYIVYLGSQRAPEYEAEDAAKLLEIIKQSSYSDIKLVVRNHPQTPEEQFKALSAKGVISDKPPKWTSNGIEAFNFNQEAIEHMKILLSNALAVTASWCTTGLLEAAILDRPVILLCWMDAVKHSKGEQVETMKVLQNYEHIKSFKHSGALVESKSPRDFIIQLEDQRENKVVYRNKRHNAVSNLVVEPLSSVCDRIVDSCETFLAKQY